MTFKVTLKSSLAQVFWMGKPDPIIYKVALGMLQLPKKSIVAIGDSLQHDIQGAYGAQQLT